MDVRRSHRGCKPGNHYRKRRSNLYSEPEKCQIEATAHSETGGDERATTRIPTLYPCSPVAYRVVPAMWPGTYPPFTGHRFLQHRRLPSPEWAFSIPMAGKFSRVAFVRGCEKQFLQQALAMA